MIKKFLCSALLCLFSAAVTLLPGGHTVLAASSSSRLIDDSIFDNTTTLNASQIDSWLNGFPNSCISPNSGFTASDPTGYSPNASFVDGHYTYGSPVTAGKVIYDISTAHGINPQVMLTKLQNEEQLVDGSQGCDNWRYASAVGYACTDSDTFSHSYTYTGADPYSSGAASLYALNDSSDLITPLYFKNGSPVNSISGSCVHSNVFTGFSEQIVHAAWALSSWRHKAEGQTGWAAVNGSWNHCEDNDSCPSSMNIPDSWACYSGLMTQGNYKRCPSDTSTVSYDGYATIDGQSLLMSTGGTAALYIYTPHIQSFDSIFEKWFGPATGPANAAAFDSESPYTVVNSGASVSLFIRFKNTGYNFWKDDQSTFAGWNPIHLAVSNPINKTSSFAAKNWLSLSRPTGVIYKVYNSDGSLDTTPQDQHTVRPGQTGEFSFTIYADPSIPGGVYREYFQPIVEGSSNWNMGTWAYLDIGVNVPSYKASWVQNSPVQTVTKGSSASASMIFKNVGTDPWYDDNSVLPGKLPVHLATMNPVNRISDFAATWPGGNRPILYPASPNGFTKVYDTGWTPGTACATISSTCLANNWHTVKVGQYAEFDVTFSAPSNEPSNNSVTGYQEFFAPIVEGAPGSSWFIPFTNIWLPWVGVKVP